MEKNSQETDIVIPKLPVCVFIKGTGVFLSKTGQVTTFDESEAQKILPTLTHDTNGMVVFNRPSTLAKTGALPLKMADILELWAFVKPAQFCVPTIEGMAKALNVKVPDTPEQYPLAVLHCVAHLFTQIQYESSRPYVVDLIANMNRSGWEWGGLLLSVLGKNPRDFITLPFSAGLDVWNRRPAWQERPPASKMGNTMVSADESLQRLSSLLSNSTEDRPQQKDFSTAISEIFNYTNTTLPYVLAEGGTGVGKTLGYLAPATVWAEKNDAPVWVSTYTRNLQHQIYNELKRLYPDQKTLYEKVVICKGRENYVCLSHFELLVKANSTQKGFIPALGIIARWLEYTVDGDIHGEDFPSWLEDILDENKAIFNRLVVKRDLGESHGTCSHSEKCFVDLPLKRAAYADIVIANHAFLMHRAKVGWLDDTQIGHIIFDEGHHLFNASDSAFRAVLSIRETHALWRFVARNDSGDLLGGKGTGLMYLITEALGHNDETVKQHLEILLSATQHLPDNNFLLRMQSGQYQGQAETFFKYVSDFVYTMDNNSASGFSLECYIHSMPDMILNIAQEFSDTLRTMITPALHLLKMLEDLLQKNSESMDSSEKKQFNLTIRSLEYRVLNPIQSWIEILETLSNPTKESVNANNSKNKSTSIRPNADSVANDNTNENATVNASVNVNVKVPAPYFIDRAFITKIQGKDMDIGISRNCTDPTHAFIENVVKKVRSCAVVSATLTDTTESPEKDWLWANLQTGGHHIASNVKQTQVKSPFDYKNKTKIIFIDDVVKDNIPSLIGAYTALFNANNGSGLGIMTAIHRLKQVATAVRLALQPHGIQVYGQHIDAMSIPTLIDIFKDDTTSCLFGTDALRDGIDVPGQSLDLLVMDKVPWQKPDILHTERRKHFKSAYGLAGYSDCLTRTKIKQAFGRLIRSMEDYGICIVLEKVPSRLKTAFPDDIEIQTLSLKQACDVLRANKIK